MVPLLKNQVNRPSRRGHVVKKGGLTHLDRGLRFRTEGQVRSKSRRLGDPDVLGDRSCDSDNLFSRGLLFLLLRDHGIEARWVRLGYIDAIVLSYCDSPPRVYISSHKRRQRLA